MIKTLTLLSIMMCFLMSCNSGELNVGDIKFEKKLDDAEFKICNPKNIKQYYVRNSDETPASIEGEKRALLNVFKTGADFPINKLENGYLTIRFIVNCNQKVGRFRYEGMDFNYKERTFSPLIVEKIINLIKGIDLWIPVHKGEKKYDYYQYFTFRIEQGQIKNITP